MRQFFKYISIFLLTFLALDGHLSATETTKQDDNDAFTVVTYNVQTNTSQPVFQQASQFFALNVNSLKNLLEKKPDIVNLQGVPDSGIQWLQKHFGNEYTVVYAPKKEPHSERKRNDTTAILYNKMRFQPVMKNGNPVIKTKYYADESGDLLLMAYVTDIKTQRTLSIVNTSIKGGPLDDDGDAQVAELEQFLQTYEFAVVSGNFNGVKGDPRVLRMQKQGLILDPVNEPTEPSSNRKTDHVFLKGSMRSKFFADACFVDAGHMGSDHKPLKCKVLVK